MIKIKEVVGDRKSKRNSQNPFFLYFHKKEADMMKPANPSAPEIRRLPRFVGTALGAVLLITAAPTLYLCILSVRFLPFFEYIPKPDADRTAFWAVCFAAFVVNAVCVLVFLFLYLSDRLDKTRPVLRYLPAWIAMGTQGATVALLLLLLLLFGAFYAVSVFLLEHGM